MTKLGKVGIGLTLTGLAGMLGSWYLAFFWVSTEATQGVVQRIFYVHVPAAWTSFLAFGIAAVTSAMYLWLRDERLDRVARSAVEGGMVFATIMITTGPLWGKIAWGTYWTWEPRLTLTLLLWFIFLGYLLVRRATRNPEKGRRFAAVVAIIGAVNIPFIHVSVQWFRSLHPGPVVVKPDGPSLPGDMLALLGLSLLSFTLVFLGLHATLYHLQGIESRAMGAAPAEAAPS